MENEHKSQEEKKDNKRKVEVKGKYYDSLLVAPTETIRLSKSKILPCTLDDYCASEGTEPEDYDLFGVSVDLADDLIYGAPKGTCEAPEGTEAIIYYVPTSTQYTRGLALIRRKCRGERIL